MTAVQAIFLVFFICLFAFAIWRKVRARALPRSTPVPTHSAHSPEPGYDPVEIARMEMESHNSNGPATMHSQMLH